MLHTAALPKVRYLIISPLPGETKRGCGAACHGSCFHRSSTHGSLLCPASLPPSVVIHYTSLRYIRFNTHALYFWVICSLIFLPFRGEIKEGATKNHARPCSFRSSSFAQIKRCFTSLIVRTALRFVPPLRALCSHPTSCSRTHPV